ncbi:MAG: hypothetical protein Q4D57_00835 [Clostridia bacterium]|nr:hypothetical protein [Clostridia bacterium]
MLSKAYIARSEKNNFTEPIIVSGKYVGIRLLSIYDFIVCIRMYNQLIKNNIFSGLDGEIYSTICEQACIAALCTYNSNGERLFSEALSTLKTLTPYELQRIYLEYNKLQDNIIKQDKMSCKIVDSVKHYHKKHMKKS